MHKAGKLAFIFTPKTQFTSMESSIQAIIAELVWSFANRKCFVSASGKLFAQSPFKVYLLPLSPIVERNSLTKTFYMQSQLPLQPHRHGFQSNFIALGANGETVNVTTD